MKFSLCTVHYVLYNMYCTLCIAIDVLYTMYCTLCTVHYDMYTMYCTSNTQWVSLVTFKSDALWDSLANVCSNSTICKFLFSFAWVSWCKFSSSLPNSSNFSWCCLQSEEGRKFPCWYRKAEERVVTNRNHLELDISAEYFDLYTTFTIVQ